MLELAPDTLLGLENVGSGLVKGVGPKLAQRIVVAFGLDAIRVIEENPERLEEVSGLGDKKRAALLAAWRDQRALRDVMVFLQAVVGAGAKHFVSSSLRKFGDGSESPPAVSPRFGSSRRGFKTADRIAASLGIARDSPSGQRRG